jgi:tellurium resistance protein TerZ
MTLTLIKGQKLSLSKPNGEDLTKIHMGLGWDPALGLSSIDLDASCIMFDADKKMVDSVWFRQLKSKCNAVVHSGDNLTGEGDGDDEVITVDLTKIPVNITQLVFTVNSFRGQTFKNVANAFCRLCDLTSTVFTEIAKYEISGGNDCTGYIMAKIYRRDGKWNMSAIGEPANGKTFQDMMPVIVSIL